MNEAQFAARLARVLDTSTEDLPPQVTARLAQAREAALARVPQSEFVPTPSRSVVSNGSRSLSRPGVGSLAGGAFGRASASFGGPFSHDDRPAWRRWLAAVLPLLIILAGLVSISLWDDYLKTQELADVETAVLTDDLPLDTLAERGFGVFLHSGGQP